MNRPAASPCLLCFENSGISHLEIYSQRDGKDGWRIRVQGVRPGTSEREFREQVSSHLGSCEVLKGRLRQQFSSAFIVRRSTTSCAYTTGTISLAP
jgi:hypothetical protein